MQKAVIRSTIKMLCLGLGLCLTAVLLPSAVPMTTYASSAYAVELVSFTASSLPNGVRLTWTTATEQSVSAFFLQRRQGNGNFVDLTQLYAPNGEPYLDGIVEAEGSPTIGATYIADDLTAVPGQTYTYQLVEIEGNNNLNPLATVTVTAGGAHTSTPISVGNNPTPTPQTTSPPLSGASPTSPPGASASANTATATRTFITATPRPSSGDTGSAPLTASPAATNNTVAGANSPALGPTATETRQAIAQTDPTPTVDDPVQPTPAVPESGYPESLATPLTIQATVTPYPIHVFTPEQNPTPTIISIIGSQPGSSASAENTAVSATSNTGILWLGFTAGLLIFIVAVAGSIMLYVRRRE